MSSFKTLPIRTTFVYLFFGFLWIYGTDRLIAVMTSDAELLITLQMVKGFLFVAVTSVVLYGLLLRSLKVILHERSNRQMFEVRLNESEDRLRTTLDGMLEGCQIIGLDWNYRYLNAAAERHNRRPNSELIGKRYVEMWPGVETTHLYTALKRCMDERLPVHFENEYRFPDGKKGWYDLSILPVPEGIFILSIDISNRKHAEEKAESLKRVYRVLSNINQLIVRSKEESVVLNEACRIIVHDGEFLASWIGLKRDAEGSFDVAASSGTIGDLPMGITVDPDDPGYEETIITETYRTGLHHVLNDIDSLSAASLWKKEAIRQGAGSSAAFPVIVHGAIKGVFVLYSSVKDFFSEEEIGLLSELSKDISFALEVMESERERKRIHTALQESERFSHSIVDALASHIAIIDERGVILTVNKAWNDFAIDNDCPLSSVGNGVNYLHVCSKAEGESAKDALETAEGILSVIRGERDEISYEYPCHSIDQQRWFIVHATRFPGEGPVRVVVAHENITKLKLSEIALIESEERYRTIIEISQDAIFIIGDDRISYVNPSAVRLFGASVPDEVLGKTPFDFIAPEDHSIIQQKITALYSGEIPLERFEQKIVRLDGMMVETEVVATPFMIRGHRAIQVVLRDISEWKKMEQNIRDSEERYRLLYENSSEAVLLTEVTGKILSANPAACRMFERTEEEICLGGRARLVDIQDPRLQPALKMREETGKFKGELNLLRGDGTVFPAFVSTVTFINSKGDRNTSMLVSDLSERKKTEDALRENEERLRLSLTAGHQGLYDLNVQTGTTIVNAEYAEMLGYDPATFVETNRSWIERLHPEDSERASRVYAEYVRGAIPEYRVEFRQRTATGDWKWILSVGRIISRTPDGEPLRMLGTHTDIDELKRAEERLALQSTALESAANGIVITDIHGRIVWANKAFSTMTGYTVEEAVGSRPSLLRSGVHTKEFYEQLWNTILSGEIWKGNVINKRKDGTLYDDEMTITPVRTIKDTITHFVAVKQDVTERNKALRRIEEQAMLLNAAHDAIILRDTDYIVGYWNKGAEQLFGYSAEEAVGKDVRTLIYRKGIDYSEQLRYLHSEDSFTDEFVMRTKSNREIILDVRMSVIRDEQGKPKSILSLSNDITEKKRVESQLLRTQRMSSLGTLAGGIAHDLNNVLSPVLLGIELLRKKFGQEDSAQIFSTIESSARRGSEIVKQILSFARGVENEKILLQPRHLMKEILGIFKETFPRSIAITTDIPNSIWTIIGDPTHFHQLIMNLGVNARDAMPEGGTLSIVAENVVVTENDVRMNIDARQGRYVKFTVSDTGCGIPEEIVDHIFEPFFTTKGVGQGTGLGLSTVYSIVKSLNGYITMQSTVGKGTSMHVFLPASELHAQSHGTALDLNGLVGHGELILVVDDEPAIREVTQNILETYAYSVVTAVDGADAIAKFSQHRNKISLVLTDIMMPVMDGRQLIVILKKIDPEIKIIASSGLVDKLKTISGQDLSVSAYIHKPYSTETLLTTIASVIQGRIE